MKPEMLAWVDTAIALTSILLLPDTDPDHVYPFATEMLRVVPGSP